MSLQSTPDLPLFGGKLHWDPSEWTSSDDRVRGGASVSHLEIPSNSPYALFTGVLDIDTLGGAGFASQRTKTDEKSWNLGGYDYIKISVQTALTDDRNYTFVLKDTLLPLDPNTGREQSTISYEVDFRIHERDRIHDTKVFYFKLGDLIANYRGKKKEDAAPLQKDAIRRFSVMMRSHFGAQSGPFRLGLLSIIAVKKPAITKSVSFHVDTAEPVSMAETGKRSNAYGTFQPWTWRHGRKEQQLTRHERIKQWSTQNKDYVVLSFFCVTMMLVILLFGLIDGHRPWPHRPPPASPLPTSSLILPMPTTSTSPTSFSMALPTPTSPPLPT